MIDKPTKVQFLPTGVWEYSHCHESLVITLSYFIRIIVVLVCLCIGFHCVLFAGAGGHHIEMSYLQ